MMKSRTIFTKQELELYPLFYRRMDVEEISNLGELNIDKKFSISNRHFSNQYNLETNNTPISNIEY